MHSTQEKGLGCRAAEGSREAVGSDPPTPRPEHAVHRQGWRKPATSSSLGRFLQAPFPFASWSPDTSLEFHEASSPPSGHTFAIISAKV